MRFVSIVILLVFSAIRSVAEPSIISNPSDILSFPDATPFFDSIPLNQELDELIVIGYGERKKSDVSASVSTIEINGEIDPESANPLQCIGGRMPGITFSASEGGASANTSVIIRGGTSITGDNSPLFIVDGFATDDISDIPVSDILRIDVIRDAASAAIYGSRASGGVVSITTKHPTKKGVHFDFETLFGTKKMLGRYAALSPYPYARLAYEVATLKGGENYHNFVSLYGTYKDLAKYREMQPHDYVSDLFGNSGAFTRQSASLSKVSDKSAFRLSYEFAGSRGIMLGAQDRKHSLALNLQQEISKKFNVALKGGYVNRQRLGAGVSTEGSASSSRLKNALLYTPIPLGGDDAEAIELGAQLFSPVEMAQDDYKRLQRNAVNAEATVKALFSDKVELHSTVGLLARFDETQRAYGLRTSQAVANGNLPLASIRNDKSSALRNTNLLRYQAFDSQRAGKLLFLFGEEYGKEKNRYDVSSSKYFPSYFSVEQSLANMSLGTAEPNVSFIHPADCLFSLFTRIEYDFRSRFIFRATLRSDRSSKFAKTRQWGSFPALSMAWKVSREPWWSNFCLGKFVDDMKLRVSLGRSGNNRIGDNLFENVYLAPSESDPTLTFDNQYHSYIKGTNYMANENLTWEKTSSRNLGLEISAANRRITLEADLYQNHTTDLLLRQELPLESGYDYIMRNVGETQNTGYELALNADIVRQKNFSLKTYVAFAQNHNKVLSLGGADCITLSSGWAGSEIEGDYILKVGESVGQIYGYETIGMYTTADFDFDPKEEVYTLKQGVASDAELLAISTLLPGTLKLRDQNNDGIIDEQDKVLLGSTQPRATGGFGFSAKIRQFDIALDFHFRIGGKVLNATKIEGTTVNKYLYRNLLAAAENHYTYIDKKGNIEVIPERLDALNANADLWSPVIGRYITHSWAVEDGSFLRFDKVSLSYNFRESFLRKVRLERLRITASVGNLFLWARYSGLDPEVSVRNQTSATPNVDYSAYPRSRSYHLSLSLAY